MKKRKFSPAIIILGFFLLAGIQTKAADPAWWEFWRWPEGIAEVLKDANAYVGAAENDQSSQVRINIEAAKESVAEKQQFLNGTQVLANALCKGDPVMYLNPMPACDTIITNLKQYAIDNSGQLDFKGQNAFAVYTSNYQDANIKLLLAQTPAEKTKWATAKSDAFTQMYNTLEEQNQKLAGTKNILDQAKTKIDDKQKNMASDFFKCSQLETVFGKITCDKDALKNFISAVFKWGVTLNIAVAVLILIFAGFQYMASGGNPDTIASAKAWILGAFTSLLLLVLARVIFSTVGLKWFGD